MLADYDVAAWHATDAVQALKPDRATAPIYIAKKAEDKWEVVFGRLADSKKSFLVVYRAMQGSTPIDFQVNRVDPPSEDTRFYLTAAKAIETASRDFGSPSRPYNKYAIPAGNSEFYVYLLPAQTKNGVFPLGGDVRYRVSSDGTTIQEKRQMHKTILEFDSKNLPKNAVKLEASYHTHVMSDTVEDSDVFFVLTRRPAIPEIIATLKKRLLEVEVDGTIQGKGKL